MKTVHVVLSGLRMRLLVCVDVCISCRSVGIIGTMEEACLSRSCYDN